MNQALLQLVNSVVFAKVQEHSNLAVQPITTPLQAATQYLSLTGAMTTSVLTVTEVDEDGSVPELLASNNGELPVIIIDGEELAGAKQNRVLNTTVLLPSHSRTTLPVSCVEEGRWHSVSDDFVTSGNILNSTLRTHKQYHVSASLAGNGSRQSDQDAIWDGVAEVSSLSAAPQSATGAMRDVYRHLDSDLGKFVEPFKLLPEQVGMAIFINGELAGIEYVSQPDIFAEIFDKLLRSYALDALLDKETAADGIDAKIAPGILAAINSADVETYDAVGMGKERRIVRSDVVGSVITLGEEIIHLSILSAKRARRTTEKTVPFPRSYWVSPSRLLAGCYPGDVNPAEATHKLSSMLDSGIRAVVNLMQEDEASHHGKPFVPYNDAIVQMGIEQRFPVVTLRKPFTDMSVPTPEYMQEILDQIDALIAIGMPVYVHCWGGRGRTGTVVGCWLARHGVAQGDEVLEHLNYLRRNDPTADKPSPQTAAQVNMVRTWREGQ